MILTWKYVFLLLLFSGSKQYKNTIQMKRFHNNNSIRFFFYIGVISGPVFTNHSQEHSLSLSPRIANLNVTQLLIG